MIGSNGRIKLDPLKDSSIDQDGSIWQDGQKVDQIKLTDFEDYNYLEKYGENFLEPVEGATFKDADGKIFSGYLEASNVNIVTEMVDLISVTRQYEANQKIIKSIDETLDIAANQIGRIG